MLEIEAENQNIRPQFLKVLCVLSWINAGITIISSSLYKMVSGSFAQSLDFISDETLKKEMLLQIEFLNGNSIWIVLLYLVSILAVFLMWNRNRNGFYIYIAVNVGLVLLPFTFFPFNAMDLISSSLVTVAFIFMYSRNLYYINS